MAVHRGVSRATTLRLSGAALITVGVLAAGTAFAAPGPAPAGTSPGILGNVSGLVGGLLNPAAPGNGPATGTDGYGNAGPGNAGNGGSGNGGNRGPAQTGAGATATGRGANSTSVGNSGAGSGNQVGTGAQAPANVGCNGVGLLGTTVSGGCGTPRTVRHTPRPMPTFPPGGPPTSKKPPTPVLAQTGTDAAGLGWLGGGLLAVGVSLLLVTRRRPVAPTRHSA